MQQPAPQPPLPQRPTGKVIPLPKRSAREREFLPAVMELVETPASPTLRSTALLLCAILAAAVLWACIAQVDTVAVAPGKIAPLGQIKVVQPLETSAIRAIHVDDGDHVTAGEALVDLDPTDAKADLATSTYDRNQSALDAEVARVLLTRDPNATFVAPDGVDPVLAEANREQARSEIRKYLALVAGLEADIAQKQAQIDVNNVAIERAKATLPLLTEKDNMAQSLWSKGLGTRQPVLDAQQQLLEKRAEISTGDATSKQIAADIQAAQAKLAEAEAGFLADAADRRTKALQKLAEYNQQIAKAQQREAYRKLVAPVDGTVQAVKIHTPGAVVTTADTLMTIVPDAADSPPGAPAGRPAIAIEVDAMVQNSDIGFIREGQQVEIKVDAFPFTRYGLVKGVVRQLSHDAVQPNAQQQATAEAIAASGGAPQNGANPAGAVPSDLIYPAKITLLTDKIQTETGAQRLQPGMRVSAEIKTGQRRVISYLLSPVIQAVTEAAHER
ncbi:HlyD family type I secretion periplasmic adaptor subunit [Methylovirgula sp. 4M-Z18]|uniref:HlyD family type I secretion periplasmic adaptor subunit n=1 Tax=Methylovirgula sp. 4M-Z18 TaxID=2293567 RepID=UPI000E2FD2FE|nr:HlyD family type I secretion periplasmic adaptor subunit [Methylovirgula sp. 4M-Z18]RFB76285.1 HlyD family type I secretion periplasmic adaptor subunit [Methylovirgula sp. 4M-Z18]